MSFRNVSKSKFGQRFRYIYFVMCYPVWDGAYKRPLAANWKE